MVSHPADVRQAIGRLDDLPRPSVAQGDRRQHRRHGRLEARIAVAGIRFLTGLVIFAAENHQIVIPMWLDAQVVIRTRRVPEQRVRHHAFCHPSGDDVAGVERELRLEQRRRARIGHADQWIVGGNHDVLAGQPMSVCLDAERILAEFSGVAMLVDLAPGRLNALHQSREILARMETRLIRESDTGSADKRHLRLERRVEPEFARERRLLLELIALAIARLTGRRVQITIHPREPAIDGVFSRDCVDLRERSQAGIPHRLSMVLAEPPRECCQ